MAVLQQRAQRRHSQIAKGACQQYAHFDSPASPPDTLSK
jgi:hypothetical protein